MIDTAAGVYAASKDKAVDGITVVGADLSRADFKTMAITNSTFEGCNIDNAVFQGCDLTGTQFKNCEGKADFRWSIDGS